MPEKFAAGEQFLIDTLVDICSCGERVKFV